METDFQRDVYCLLGLPFDALDSDGVIGRIRSAARHRTPLFLSTPNLSYLTGSMGDSELRDSVLQSDLSVADGMPVVWIARLLGLPIRERISGSSLFEALGCASGDPMTVYIFGAPDGVAGAACRRINELSRGLVCVGFESPGFGSLHELSVNERIDRINASQPDFLLLSFSARKGQAWIQRNRVRLTSPVICNLGATANFVAGSIGRAPAWMQRAGLEWLWRIKEEPHLWRRYFRDGIALIGLLVTRVLPYAWQLRRHWAGSDRISGGRVDAGEEGESYVIRLSGAWTRQNIDPLRKCFSRAARLGRDITIEMSSVTSVDAAFLALAALLLGSQKRCSRRLLVVGCGKPVRKIVRYCCAEYLLSDAGASDGDVPVVERGSA